MCLVGRTVRNFCKSVTHSLTYFDIFLCMSLPKVLLLSCLLLMIGRKLPFLQNILLLTYKRKQKMQDAFLSVFFILPLLCHFFSSVFLFFTLCLISPSILLHVLLAFRPFFSFFSCLSLPLYLLPSCTHHSCSY